MKIDPSRFLENYREANKVVSSYCDLCVKYEGVCKKKCNINFCRTARKVHIDALKLFNKYNR